MQDPRRGKYHTGHLEVVEVAVKSPGHWVVPDRALLSLTVAAPNEGGTPGWAGRLFDLQGQTQCYQGSSWSVPLCVCVFSSRITLMVMGDFLTKFLACVEDSIQN